VVTADALDRLAPCGGSPAWVSCAPYLSDAHPGAADPRPWGEGANCQRYAYAVLALFAREVPPHRSSELWADLRFGHPPRDDARDLDLALFGRSEKAWGAHVAVVVGDVLLHLCAEVGRPTTWRWSDFAERERHSHLVGLVRVAPN